MKKDYDRLMTAADFQMFHLKCTAHSKPPGALMAAPPPINPDQCPNTGHKSCSSPARATGRTRSVAPDCHSTNTPSFCSGDRSCRGENTDPGFFVSATDDPCSPSIHGIVCQNRSNEHECWDISGFPTLLSSDSKNCHGTYGFVVSKRRR